VAYDDWGAPTILRQVDDGHGQARTIVHNEDGSRKVFGANTVASLVGSPDADARRWLGALRDREIHGLVHELGKRLVESSQQYTLQRAQLEQLERQRHFDYFSLQQGASEKDLHAAYRRLARRMHPDKNGGTEEAKRKFQHMKERYESLLEGYRPAAPADDAPGDGGGGRAGGDPRDSDKSGEGGPGSEGEEEGDDGAGAGSPDADGKGGSQEGRRRGRSRPGRDDLPGQQSPGGRRREAYDEDDDESQAPRRRRQKGGGSGSEGAKISYDPSDRGSMDDTIWRMVQQMRRLQESLTAVSAKMKRSC